MDYVGNLFVFFGNVFWRLSDTQFEGCWGDLGSRFVFLLAEFSVLLQVDQINENRALADMRALFLRFGLCGRN